MIINILAGGPEDLLPDLTGYESEEAIWVGVDRGVFHLINRNIIPAMAFGDFDSVNEEELSVIESRVDGIKKYRPEKDETDMELALNWALEQKPNRIHLFGATGGRLDHLLANVQLLLNPIKTKNPADVYLIDKKNMIFLKEAGFYTIEKMASKKYVSFVPLTLDITDLTLKGFKFPLKNRHISLGSTLCISNELIGDYGTFSFSKGILIVVRSND